ncbi:protein of unknown function (plasmid) [Candidatus Methylocalor cossyra]|uniref:Uncharacterized protein n=1 Tax=Candidatus Methylocalor cossyra TaxID=3108543 RepID=A0ABP1CCY9_9GAMM
MPSGPNEVWSIAFAMEALSNGQRLKGLTIVDDVTQEAVDSVVDHGISGRAYCVSAHGVISCACKKGVFAKSSNFCETKTGSEKLTVAKASRRPRHEALKRPTNASYTATTFR